MSIILPLESGRHQRLATFDAGSAIGEFSVVDKRPRSANIIANTAVTCLVVDLQELETNPSQQARQVRAAIIENVARRLVDLLRKANTGLGALSI